LTTISQRLDMAGMIIIVINRNFVGLAHYCC
jgi:hypothetical protein